jgi:glycosyltransferase involved in cell wall biosynthesis
MKILVLNWRDTLHPKAGGAEYVTHEHAKAWVQAGHEVTWFTSMYHGAKPVEFFDGVKIIRSGGSYLVYLLAPFFLLRNTNQYDVIIDEIHGIPFFAPLFSEKPVIVFIHEIADEIWDYMYRFPLNFVGKWLESLYLWLYRNKYFWTDAASTVDELVKRGIDRNMCLSIPCPVKPVPINKTVKEKVPTYIFVSRVVRMKGIEEVIKSFAFILKVQADACLWIVGGGEDNYVGKLKEMIAEYELSDHVHFWGRVSEAEKYELMARAHLLLHASVKEGWGLVVLEAASVGTPAVVYNVGGLRDIVKHNKTGFIVKDISPQNMAREAVSLINDKKRYRLYQAKGQKWVKSLSWDNVTKQSLELLFRVVEKTA